VESPQASALAGFVGKKNPASDKCAERVIRLAREHPKALRVEHVESVLACENCGLPGFFYGAGFEQPQRLSFDERVV